MRLKYPVDFVFQINHFAKARMGNASDPQAIPNLILSQVFPGSLSVILNNCSDCHKICQDKISRSCLALASGPFVSHMVSSLKKEKEVGWLGEEETGKKRGDNRTHLSCYLSGCGDWWGSFETSPKSLQGKHSMKYSVLHGSWKHLVCLCKN